LEKSSVLPPCFDPSMADNGVSERIRLGAE
jgi:hypothetical protein